MVRQTGIRAFALVIGIALCAATAHAQTPPPVKRDTVVRLPDLGVTVKRGDSTRVPAIQRLTLPATAGVTAAQVRETVNLLDTEDAVKYFPSVFLRKRNYGDTQATMQTRVWGVSSSARSLVFADGVPLSALIANNNTVGAPRWGIVAPEEIARIDMMYGPFSAAYAGNSMGAVMEITTRRPTRLEGSLSQTQALQTFNLYGTDRTFGTSQTAAHFGDRFGKLSIRAGVNYQHSNSQPLSYVTSGSFPAGTSGGFPEQNKLGTAANVLGASGLLQTDMTNATLKAAFDISPVVRAGYTFSFWNNSSAASADPFTRDAAGRPTYAGQAGFASGSNELLERHTAHSLSLRTDTRGDWDFEAIATLYRFNTDRQRSPATASASGTTLSTPGRVAFLDGTGWQTLDLKGAWHAGGPGATHALSFGAHYDRYRLHNPTFNVPDWRNGDSASATGLATQGDGRTRTAALWAQERWLLSPYLVLTVGGRYEDWRGYDGLNVNGSTRVIQPEVSASKFSPKASLSWAPTDRWTIALSAAKAYRFATAAELYQLVSTGTTFTSPDPHLKPDDDFSTELRIERRFDIGRVQLSLFQDDVHDAIISQFLPLVPGSTTLFSYLSNVDHVRARGFELILGRNNVIVRDLEVSGTVTYVDAKTLALSGRASATAPEGSAIGKRLPNIPDWRGSLISTYRANDRLSMTVTGRYSGKIYTTLDNADVNPNTYQGFSNWFVVDARAAYRFGHHIDAALGVDNINNRKYFLFHPFPQRTFVGSLRYGF